MANHNYLYSTKGGYNMCDALLNRIYTVYTGGLISRPILEVIEELYPDMPKGEKVGIADSLKQVKDEIDDYFFYRYDHNDNAHNSMLQKEGVEYFRKQHPWMSEENLIHTISRAMYYAWHG